MAPWTLALSSALAAVSAATFLHVARSIARRPASPEMRAPARWFAAYWIGAAIFAAIAGVQILVAMAGYTPTALFVATRTAMTLVGSAALAALLAYLLFLYTGRRLLVQSGALYAGVGLLAAFETLALEPTGVRVGAWHVELTFAREPGLGALLALLLVFVPPLAGAIAYAALWPRVQSPAGRWRIGLVSASLFLWYTGQLASRIASDDLWMFLTRPILGLAVASLTLVAFSPPAWLRARWDAQTA